MSEPMSERERWQLELDKLQRGLQGDPFAFLGPQRDPGGEGGVGGGGGGPPRGGRPGGGGGG
ncbi:hypothetical protein JQX05_23585, partial [Pseudomonas sp. BIS1]|uniref:hypothetical protein n=1 Tax=Pseudomonas sp. BIS1 TaxID=2807722 RepID=UPI00193C54D9